MAIAEDSSTPAVVHATGLASGSAHATTATFSPPANSLLVAVVSLGYGATQTSGNPSFAMSGAGGASWTTGPAVYDNIFAWSGIFTCQLGSSPGSFTVTATDSTTFISTVGIQLAVRVVTGAAASQTGAASATNSNNPATAMTGSITTTAAGSWVYVGAMLGNQATLSAFNASTTLTDSMIDATDAVTGGFGRQASATGTPGATTLGFTSTVSADYSWAALEILPAAGGGPAPSFASAQVQPSRTFQQFFRYGQRQKLVVPTWQPDAYGDTDASTGADGGEAVTVLDATGEISGPALDAGESLLVTSPPAGAAQPSRTWSEHFRPRPKLQLPVASLPAAVFPADLDSVKGFDGVGTAPDTVVPVPDTGHCTDAGESITVIFLPFAGQGTVQPSRTWTEHFRPQPKLQLPPAPTSVFFPADTDASGPEIDAGPDASGNELIFLADTDASAGLDAGESLVRQDFVMGPVRASRTWTEHFRPQPKLQLPLWKPDAYGDSDASAGLDAGERTAAVSSDTGHGTDAGEAIAATSSGGLGFATAVPGLASPGLAVPGQPSPLSTQFAAGDAVRGTETGTVAVSDGDAGHSTDGGESLARRDFVLGLVAPSPAWLTRWGRQRFPKQVQGVFFPQVQTGAVDADRGLGEDSEIDNPGAVSSDLSVGTDNTETLLSSDSDAGLGTERELTAWPSDADSGGTSALFASSGELEFWSGPLSDPVPDTCTGTDGPTPVVFQFALADAGSGLDGHVIDVYTFQPPFRFTGGQYELRVPHPGAGVDVARELTLWRGERPDGTAYRLYAAFAAGRLDFRAAADTARARDDEDVASLPVTLHVAGTLPVRMEIRRSDS